MCRMTLTRPSVTLSRCRERGRGEGRIVPKLAGMVERKLEFDFRKFGIEICLGFEAWMLALTNSRRDRQKFVSVLCAKTTWLANTKIAKTTQPYLIGTNFDKLDP